jgi:hypothetical protein
MGRDERNNMEARRFAQEIGARSRQIDARDRFNRRLQVGATILLTPTHPMTYTVEKIDPVLDPRAPAGTIQLTLTALVSTIVAAGVPWPDGVIVAVPATPAVPAAGAEAAAPSSEAPVQDTERETQSGVVRFPEPAAAQRADEPPAAPAIVLTDGD